MTETTKRNIKSILLYILVALFLVFEMGVQVSPSVMTTPLMHDLTMGTFGLGLMSGFYFYTYTGMQIPSGLLFDRFNPRLIIAISIFVCSMGALSFGLATNIYIGSLARLLMGMGSAFAFVSVLVVSSDLFQQKYFALIAGITQMLAAIGAMMGQLPLSFLVSGIGWRHTMFLLAGVGFVLMILVWSFLRYKTRVKHEICFEERVTISRGMKAILKNKQSWFVAIYALLLWAPMSGFASLWGVSYLMHVAHLSKHTAAIVCSFMWIGLAVASPLLGWLSIQMESRKMPLILSALIGVVAFIGVIFFPNVPVWLLALMIFLAGAACSGQALSFTVVTENNHPSRRATAIAFNNMAVVISGALLQPLIGKLLAVSFIQDIALRYQFGLSVILVCYIVGLVLAVKFIRESFA